VHGRGAEGADDRHVRRRRIARGGGSREVAAGGLGEGHGDTTVGGVLHWPWGRGQVNRIALQGKGKMRNQYPEHLSQEAR